MSLRTKIKGFTAWVNLRLKSYDQLLNNVLMDLLSGTHMKYLVRSIIGKDVKRLESLDDLSQAQKQTRVEWAMDELRSCGVIPGDIQMDTRLIAMRSSDQVFDLLWRLVCHDIWFVWERAEYLQHEDNDILTQVPFKWTPDPPPEKKKKSKPKKSLLSGFGPSPDSVEEDCYDDWVKYPNSEWMKNFKKKRRDPDNYPGAEDCILDMVNYQLKTTRDGQNLSCQSVDDFVDSRVLCSLVNSFVPNTFTTDLLLNDRWTINLALRTAEEMFYTKTPFDSEDLVEADPPAVCAYFCHFFMVAYKFRQCKAAVERVEFINMLIRECNHELSKFPAIVSNMQELQRRKEVKQQIEQYKQALVEYEIKFDLPYCRKWMQHITNVQGDVRRNIKDKMRSKFDIVTVPRSITVNDLCLSYVINLTLTSGSGFYLAKGKEVLNEGRKVVLRNRENGDFFDDFSSDRNRKGLTVRSILKLPRTGVVEVVTDHFPDLDIFVEAPSRNKLLKPGIRFLYQVFPGNTVTWQRLFIRASKENELETVQKMIIFFQNNPQFINAKEPKTGNTALHWACKNGHYEMVCLLLDNGANVDSRNTQKSSPLFLAIEGLHRRVAHLLLEWGCDVHCKNVKNLTPFETIKNDEFKQYLIELYEHYSDIVPKIMEGDFDLLDEVIEAHRSKRKELCNLQSRCINGSTLLHTAAYYGHIPAIKELLQMRMDANLRDYKGASPLHRAKNVEVLSVLLEAGANCDAEDIEGNTPLHVKCYGETGKPPDLESIEILLSKNANMARRNSRGLLPIHCCAMQGRIDVMQMMLHYDTDGNISKAISSENDRKPPSVPHLAIANDFVDCADWANENGFYFKSGEQNMLLRRILTEQINLKQPADGVKFLLDGGADPNPRYPGGNSAVHYAAGMSGSSDVLEMLVNYGADYDTQNDEGNTPLFYAAKSNNQYAASALIEQGANVRQKNMHGLTAFDYIVDFEEWIDSGFFTDEIKARLKAYNLKHARDLVRAISKRVKPSSLHLLKDMEYRSVFSSSLTTTQPHSNSYMTGTGLPSQGALSMTQSLPPIRVLSAAHT